jgi:hypothetical protein
MLVPDGAVWKETAIIGLILAFLSNALFEEFTNARPILRVNSVAPEVRLGWILAVPSAEHATHFR